MRKAVRGGRAARRRGPLTHLVRTGVVAVIFVSCSSGGAREGAQVQGIPVVQEAVHGPGTSLPDGFSVARGSRLLGAAFPERASYTDSNGHLVETRGWRAILLATGDVQDVIDAYRDQAKDHRIPTRHHCYRRNDSVVVCDLSGLHEHVQFGVTVTRSETRPTSSHIAMTYSETLRGAFPVFPAVPPPASEAHTAMALPEEWPRLPRVGEYFGAGFLAPVLSDAPGLRVVPGSELVAPVGEDSTRSTGSWIAVLRVTGAPRRVVQQYVEQIGPYGFETKVQESSVDGATTLTADADERGESDYEIEAIVRPGSPTYLRVERCGEN